MNIFLRYRDHAGYENNFDEIKNQWDWSGLVARKNPIEPFYRMDDCSYSITSGNWSGWQNRINIMNPSFPGQYYISQRGKQTIHAAQKTLTITSTRQSLLCKNRHE